MNGSSRKIGQIGMPHEKKAWLLKLLHPSGTSVKIWKIPACERCPVTELSGAPKAEMGSEIPLGKLSEKNWVFHLDHCRF